MKNWNQITLSSLFFQRLRQTREIRRHQNQTRETLWLTHKDKIIQKNAFSSRYLNNDQKSYSVEDLQLLAVVWEPEYFCFHLHGENLFNDQALDPLIKRNPVHRQYSARLTKMLDRLAYFDFSKKSAPENKVEFPENSKRHSALCGDSCNKKSTKKNSGLTISWPPLN